MRRSLWPEGSEREHLAEIDAFLFGVPTPPPAIRAVLLLVVRSRPVGFLELSVREYAEGCSGPTPYIEGWYVDPEHRGTGGGRALVAAAEAWAVANGYDEMASDSLEQNAVSVKAHRALGFEEVERIVAFRKSIRR